MEKRTCGECTKCCDGWLPADINGHKMYPGKPCHFLAQGKCSIYEDRPETPCKVYKCAWLEDERFPTWIKPSLTNVVISKKVPEDKTLTYYDVTECGGKIDSVVLNWIIQWALSTSTNLIYQVNGVRYMLGTPTFTQAVKKLANSAIR